MRPGSVIVDLAAEQGGNCELTEPGEVVVRDGVTIIGYTDLPSRLAKQASTLYATNLLRLTEELCKTKDGVINVNFDDEVIRGTTVIKDGRGHLAAAAADALGRAAAGEACRGSRRAGQEDPVTAMAPANPLRPRASPSCSAWARCCSGSSARSRRPRSSRTSRCSCSPASSATW